MTAQYPLRQGLVVQYHIKRVLVALEIGIGALTKCIRLHEFSGHMPEIFICVGGAEQMSWT